MAKSDDQMWCWTRNGVSCATRRDCSKLDPSLHPLQRWFPRVPFGSSPLFNLAIAVSSTFHFASPRSLLLSCIHIRTIHTTGTYLTKGTRSLDLSCSPYCNIESLHTNTLNFSRPITVRYLFPYNKVPRDALRLTPHTSRLTHPLLAALAVPLSTGTIIHTVLYSTVLYLPVHTTIPGLR